jgi:hypothetical protein
MPATTTNDKLRALDRPLLGKLRLAASTILDIAEDDLLPSPLEAELYLFRDRVAAALNRPEQ